MRDEQEHWIYEITSCVYMVTTTVDCQCDRMIPDRRSDAQVVQEGEPLANLLRRALNVSKKVLRFDDTPRYHTLQIIVCTGEKEQ